MTTLDYLIEANEKIVAKGLSEENVEELRACWQEYKNERAAGRESVELKEILRFDDLILHYKGISRTTRHTFICSEER